MFFLKLGFPKKISQKSFLAMIALLGVFRPGEIRPKPTVGPGSIFHEVEVKGHRLPIGLSLLGMMKSSVMNPP